MINDKHIEAIACAVAEKISDRHGSSCEFCLTDDRRKAHRLEHEFIQGLMKVADRWDTTKWELLRDILKWSSRIIVIAMLTGLIVMAVKTSGMQLK